MASPALNNSSGSKGNDTPALWDRDWVRIRRTSRSESAPRGAWPNSMRICCIVVLRLALRAPPPSFQPSSAPTVTGTFTNILGATSPHTNALTTPQQFFRLAQ